MKHATFLFLVLLFSVPVLAQEKDLMINASGLNFDREKGIVEATGSVEAVYHDVKITGEHMVYNEASREAYLDSGFNFIYGDLNFSGQTLKYNLNSESGQGTMTKIKYQNANISGTEVDFNRAEAKVRNATFTACDLVPPHYHLSASEIDLFQKQGWLAAYWGVFWLGSFPSIPIPVYVYDFNAGRKGQKNVMPYPEVGSDSEDGSWVMETMSWHLRPDLNGTYSVEYSANRGFGFGFLTNYLIDQDQRLEQDIFVDGGVGPRMGMEYSRQFGPSLKDNKNISLIPDLDTKQYQLDTRFLSRERINYEEVSMCPDIAFSFRSLEFLAGKLDGSVSAGQIGEQSSGLWTGRENLSANLSYPFAGDFTLSGAVDASYYGNGVEWVKVPGNIGYTKKINSVLTSRLNYFHYFEDYGQSPFNYENYRFFGNDQIGFGLTSKTEYLNLTFNCSYLLPDLAPQDIDYTMGMLLHCFEVNVTYRATRQEFILGMSLN